jgi:hypothetical protein
MGSILFQVTYEKKIKNKVIWKDFDHNMSNSFSKINIVGELRGLLVKSDNVTLHSPITRAQSNLSICLTHLMK